MIQTFTQLDLIRFIYNETTNEQHRDIELALLCNNELMEEYKSLKSTANALAKVSYAPSNSTIEKILNYSKSTNLHTTH
ncbi:MAG: hypothetical protein L3J29_10115 [Cyclobacteriaceae bacterium]|nr:hypothetical protein [Cyclobacteriaceae bacterium]